MNKLLFITMGLLLSPPPVLAASDAAIKSDENTRLVFEQSMSKQLKQAIADIAPLCNGKQASIPKQRWHTSLDKSSANILDEEMESAATVSWEGKCKDGRRIGAGTLTITTTDLKKLKRRSKADTSKLVTVTKLRGQLVLGEQVGLWCRTWSSTESWNSAKPTRKDYPNRCAIYGGGLNRLLTEEFTKNADGSWSEIDAVGEPWLIARGVLEAQTQRMIKDAASDNLERTADIPLKSELLNGLVRDSTLTYRTNNFVLDFADKRIALVLSSGALAEIGRYDRERNALLASSENTSGNAIAERKRFIEVSDQKRLLINAAKAIAPLVKSVTAANDLSGLKRGEFDYAFIIGWKPQFRFDKFGKYESPSQRTVMTKKSGIANNMSDSIACESLSSLLIDSKMHVVKRGRGFDYCSKQRISDIRSDQQFFASMADYFETDWGKGADNLGRVSNLSRYTFMLLKGQDGYCWQRYSNGDIYEGGLLDGLYDGQGTLKNVQGEYSGGWIAGKKHGRGTYRSADGLTIYEGEFKDNYYDGQGSLKDAAGKYTGNWKAGKKDGRGAYVSADEKTTYEGEYKYDFYNGRGMLIDAYGKYTGDWFAGKKSGKGSQSFADGSSYEGGWKDGQFEGEGIDKWANGDQYRGNFKAHKMDGDGVYSWPDGSRFEGEWRQGNKFNGVSTLANGSTIEFVNGKSSKQIVNEVSAEYDRRIKAAQDQCNSQGDSCSVGCSTVVIAKLLAKSTDAGDNSACYSQCRDEQTSCNRQANYLVNEKNRAVSNARTPSEQAQSAAARARARYSFQPKR